MHVCVYIHVGTRNQCQASYSTSFHFVYFRIGLSLNLDPTNPARLVGQQASGVPLTVPPELGLQVYTAIPSVQIQVLTFTQQAC